MYPLKLFFETYIFKLLFPLNVYIDVLLICATKH